LALFATSLNLEPPTFENAARHPSSETKVQCCHDRPMSLPSLSMHSCAPSPEMAHENVLNRQ